MARLKTKSSVSQDASRKRAEKYLVPNIDAARKELPDLSPCDSPIEDIFYYEFQKYVAKDAKILRQVEAPVASYTFQMDFLVVASNRKVGFECDGKDFHDVARDSWRDKEIIKAGYAQAIYRLRGRDIHYYIHDALDLIRKREPQLFSERGHANISLLATREYERRDETFPTASGFPYAMIRRRERPPREPDCDDEEEDLTWKEVFPTVVCWTQLTRPIDI